MKQTILIVEDEEILVKALEEQFKKAGFKTEAAFDGEQALESLKKSVPDLILLDIILPKKNGFDVLKAVKENPDTQGIPIIMISNLGSDEDIKQSIKLGAVDYYVKAQHPIYEITEKVAKFLSVPKSPLKKAKAPVATKKAAAEAGQAIVPSEAAEKKPVEKVFPPVGGEKPKIIEKPAEKIAKIIPEKIIEKKPIKKVSLPAAAEKPIEKPTEKKFPPVGGEKPKVVEKPVEANKSVKKPAEKIGEKPKIVEKIFSPVGGEKKPLAKQTKEEYPQLSKGARKFIRMKKAELRGMNLPTEEYEAEIAKIYQTFSKKN